MQLQLLIWQTWFAPQTFPQAPQLFMSVLRFVHLPLQHACPGVPGLGQA
jgi:hypothetical protein